MLLSSLLFAGDDNPASVQYVDDAASAAIQRTTHTAGDGISITGSEVSTTATVQVGDLYQGGIVFYVDDTNRHGLAVGLGPRGNLTWANTASPTTAQTYASGVGAGLINTATAIAVSKSQGGNTAFSLFLTAQTAVESDGLTSCLPQDTSPVAPVIADCYGGWYMGAASEYKLIIDNFNTVNSAIVAQGGNSLDSDSFYWTSTTASDNDDNAITVSFVSMSFSAQDKLTISAPGRPIRQF